MKGRITCLSITILLLGSVGYGQYFQGKIVYSNKYSSKTQKFTDEQLGLLIGTEQEYFIKGGYYKSLMNGQSISMQLYDYSTNRIYNKTPKSDTLYYFDASINTDDVISWKIEKNKEVILGYRCDALILKTRTGTTTLYYNSRFLLDAGKYSRHHYSNWALFTSKAGALPLKIVVESNLFSMVSTASNIEPLDIKDEYFLIDSKIPIMKTR